MRQLSERCLHLESALQVSNAQLAVASLEKRSLQAAFDDATQQLTARETDAVLMGAQLATQEADLQVRHSFSLTSNHMETKSLSCHQRRSQLRFQSYLSAESHGSEYDAVLEVTRLPLQTQENFPMQVRHSFPLNSNTMGLQTAENTRIS